MFYEPIAVDRFLPTKHTVGPWTTDAQHFGPPSALLTRALEQLPAERPMMLARITVEILGPAPISELTTTASIARPGRSVELVSAELRSDTRTVARASAWRIATSDTAELTDARDPALPSPDAAPVAPWPPNWHTDGYLDAMEWRTISGSPATPGPAAVWVRQRYPLVGDEQPSPLQRLMVVADSGNGVSNLLDPTTWWFINSELTVHVHRLPVGAWIGLDATTAIGPTGVGTATSTLHDTAGTVGAGAQALLVRRR